MRVLSPNDSVNVRAGNVKTFLAANSSGLRAVAKLPELVTLPASIKNIRLAKLPVLVTTPLRPLLVFLARLPELVTAPAKLL